MCAYKIWTVFPYDILFRQNARVPGENFTMSKPLVEQLALGFPDRRLLHALLSAIICFFWKSDQEN
jgi:hypothetical protein